MRRHVQLAAVFFWIVPATLFAYLSVVAPWPAAGTALASLESRFDLVVAMSYQSSSSGPGTRSQVYISLPASLRTLDAYTVVTDAAGTRAETIPFGAIIFGGFYATWIAVSFWYLRNRHRLPLARADDA